MTQKTNAATTGGIYAFVAYLLWGLFPLYFLTLLPSTPWEIVAWRVLLTLVFCLVALTVTRGWAALARIIRRPRLLGWTAAAGILVFVNWATYLVAVLAGHVVEASLGYFINPIVTVLLGVVVLHERLRPAQWAAIGIALAAVAVIVVGYGQVPWIALLLAFSFGFYGLAKNRVGGEVDAVSGLTLETAWLTPVAVAVLIWVGATSGVTLGTAGAGHTVLLLLAGVVTAVPLLLFAAATRRAPLSLVGLLQFLTPILQFVTGVALLHEDMSLERWVGFTLVWVALVVLSVDSVRHARRRRGVGEVAEIA